MHSLVTHEVYAAPDDDQRAGERHRCRRRVPDEPVEGDAPYECSVLEGSDERRLALTERLSERPLTDSAAHSQTEDDPPVLRPNRNPRRQREQPRTDGGQRHHPKYHALRAVGAAEDANSDRGQCIGERGSENRDAWKR